MENKSIAFDERRLKNVTATEMATLFGLNPYDSPAKLIDRKKNPVDISNNHTRRGKLKEPSVLEAFLIDGGIETERHLGGTLVHTDHRIAATPDAYIKGRNEVVECKTTLSSSFKKWYKAIPTYYHVQVITQMMVTGSEVGYIGALEEGDPAYCEYLFAAWKVHTKPRMYELIAEEVTRFWESWDSDKLFRVNSANKKEMLSLMEGSSELILPTIVPEEVESEDISEILALFK